MDIHIQDKNFCAWLTPSTNEARRERGPRAELDWRVPTTLQVLSVTGLRRTSWRPGDQVDTSNPTSLLLSDGQHIVRASLAPGLREAWCEDAHDGLLLQPLNVVRCDACRLRAVECYESTTPRLRLRLWLCMHQPFARLIRMGPYRHWQSQAAPTQRGDDAMWPVTGDPVWLRPVPTISWVVLPSGGHERLAELAAEVGAPTVLCHRAGTSTSPGSRGRRASRRSLRSRRPLSMRPSLT